MREIEFRGKDFHSENWVYGFYHMLYLNKGEQLHHFIRDANGTQWEVRAGTIGQYIGIKSDNKKLYEGDILKVYKSREYTANRDNGGGIVDYSMEEGFYQIGVVEFNGCSYFYKTIKTISGKHEDIQAPIDWLDNFEVAGNIVDNRWDSWRENEK